MLGTTIGNYKVIAQLGEGGMGIVYLAEHPALGRKAAIKVLHPRQAADPQVVSRFFLEARATNAIRHPNIVEAYDYGTLPDGAPYIIMEHLEGESLGARIQRVGRLPLRTALDFARQAAGALAAAHGKQIVHRDLKPDNLFVTSDPRSPGGELIKILDFGIAKLAASPDSEVSHKTRTGTLMGTPLYMSPEQCLGVREVDHRSDVYSLGCILFEMLCGEPPFVSEGFGALVNMHVNQPPERPSRRNSEVPASVDRLVLKMLAKDVEDRTADMEAVQAALTPEIARAPVLRATVPTVAGPISRAKFAGTTLSAASAAVSTESRERGRGRGKGVLVVVGTAALAVGAFALLRGGAAPPPVVAPRAAEVAPPVVAPAPPTPPPAAPTPEAKIEATLDSTPPGALVTVDGVAIGTTPMIWRTAEGGRPKTLTFALEGYRREVIQTLPAAGLRLAPALKRLASRHAHVPAPARPAPRPVDDIKTER